LFQNGALRHARAKNLLKSAMPKPDVLVVLTCDPAIHLERLRRTDRPHVREKQSKEILAETTGDVFARDFAQLRDVPIIEIDTSDGSDGDGIDTLRQKLRPWIETAHARFYSGVGFAATASDSSSA